MKRITPALLLLLAIFTGLLLPQAVLRLADNSLVRSTRQVPVTEPELLAQPQDATKSSTDLLLHLALYRSETPTTVPMVTETEAQVTEAIAAGAQLLESILGSAPECSDSWAEYHLAYFSDGTAFGVWEVWLMFDESWVSQFVFDGSSGAPLSFFIRSSEVPLFGLLPQYVEADTIPLGEHIAAILSQNLPPLEYLPEEQTLLLHSGQGELALSLYIRPAQNLISFNPSPSQEAGWDQ